MKQKLAQKTAEYDILSVRQQNSSLRPQIQVLQYSVVLLSKEEVCCNAATD